MCIIELAEMVPAIGMEGPASRNSIRYTRLFMMAVIVQYILNPQAWKMRFVTLKSGWQT